MGILMKGPAHGYELKQMLEKELSPFFQVSATPLYYTLKKLEKEKLVSSRQAASGRRPVKYVYQLTPSGKARIKKILLSNIADLQRPFLNLDISLYFSNLLKSKDVDASLKERKRELRKLIFLLYRQKKRLAKEPSEKWLYVITAHNLRFAHAEMDFVKDLIETLSENTSEQTDLFNKVKKNNDRR